MRGILLNQDSSGYGRLEDSYAANHLNVWALSRRDTPLTSIFYIFLYLIFLILRFFQLPFDCLNLERGRP